MKKHLGKIIALLIVISIAIAFSVRFYINRENTKEIVVLPHINLQSIDSTFFSLPKCHNASKTLVILFFHPNCEICQFEVEELLKSANILQEIQFVFVTLANSEEVKSFLQKNPIEEKLDARVGIDYKAEFVTKFTPKTAPHIYIYDKNKHLKKHTNALIKPSVLAKFK
ncbi:MAG: peroxiredoxin family protein [Bacteroidales bacterium]|jgi:thiol-disulfide isomerase/thioredoxin|nr:peroxiredoxin family protein [Bacteroidales bacterium]